ncbi:MAG: efflux RND transporter periplasmic adaptor subunit [Pseudomonadota bacterium]
MSDTGDKTASDAATVMAQVADDTQSRTDPADKPAQLSSTPNSPSMIGRLVSVGGFLIVAGACVGAMFVGIAALHARADAEQSVAANPVIAVNTQPLTLQDSYVVTRAFVGRVEPRRETALAFELAGTVRTVGADEGDAVKAGDVVAEIDTARLETRRQELNAQKQELQAQLDLAQATAGRQRTLKRRGWTADQRFDEARFQVARLRGSIERVDAGIAAVEVDLRKSVLRAPFDGRIASRSIDEGAIVAPGTPVVRVLEMDGARVRVGVNRATASDLKLGRSYQLQFGDDLIDGRLASLRPDLDPASRTATALFDLMSATQVPFGSVVTLNIDRSIGQSGSWVSLASLSEGAKGLWTVLTVVVRDGRQIVQREAVEVLHVAEGRAFIRSSIPEGTPVITDGINRVAPGQRVAMLQLGNG